jgi:site-specific recombinase XerD
VAQFPVPREAPAHADFDYELRRDPRLKSEHTKRGYAHDLQAFEEWRTGRPMTKLLVEEYAAELQAAAKSPNTINRSLAAVRWWARRLGDLAYESPGLEPGRRQEIVTQSARVAAVRDVRGKRQPKGRHIYPGELRELLRVCLEDPQPSGVRDAAMIALAWVTGMRRGEISGLLLSDYTPTGENEGDLLIRGKGDVMRVAYVFEGAAAALVDWLAFRGAAPGRLFCPVLKSGKIRVGWGMTTEAMAQMLDKRALQAGLDKPITWHDFRRTFAGNLLEAGHDLVTVQKLMGHATPVTTSLYDRRGEESRRRAVRSLHVPYGGRSVP